MEGNTGIYDYSRRLVTERYEGRIHGAREALILGLSCERLPEDVEEALRKSVHSLGWGDDSASFALVEGLSPNEAFELIEGLDPVAIVIADEGAARIFFAAYRIGETSAPAFRVLGREIRLVPEFAKLINTLNGKQKIWSVLKTLPRA